MNTEIERLVNEFKEIEHGRLAQEQDLQHRLDELGGQRKSFEDTAVDSKNDLYFAHRFRFLPEGKYYRKLLAELTEFPAKIEECQVQMQSPREENKRKREKH